MNAELDAARLSSLASMLDECETRATDMAAIYQAAKREDLLSALHEAERLARAAAREVRRAQRLLGH
jgi:hypothetical protein